MQGGCVSSVTQRVNLIIDVCMCLQLCVYSSVDMLYVWVETIRCLLLSLFLYIMELYVLSYYKKHDLIMYKNNGNKHKNAFK